MGPALLPGSLLNLDLVLVPSPPVPEGVWGLVPEIPRRVPMWVPFAWVSGLVGADTVGKVAAVCALAFGTAGAARLSSLLGAGRAAALGAGMLYSFAPFALTRLAIGHWMITFTMALLPWLARDLLFPSRSLRRLFAAGTALALTGSFGGTVGLLLVLCGLVADRMKRAGPVLATAVCSQLLWLAPMTVVVSTAASVTSSPQDASPFATRLGSTPEVVALPLGGGFWNPYFEVGRGSPVTVVASVVVVLLALVGSRAAWRPSSAPGSEHALPVVDAQVRSLFKRLSVVGCLALLWAASSGFSPTREVYAWFTRSPLGAPFRESHRLLALHLLWLAPAAAVGAEHLRRATRMPDAVRGAAMMLPAAASVVAAGPAVWGAGGQLEPVRLPAEWAAAREMVRAHPGTTVVLPWAQYFTADVAGGRLVLVPVPLYLGGDVIVSSDLNLSSEAKLERLDPREVHVARLAAYVEDDWRGDVRLGPGRPAADRLAQIGVRWVVLLHDLDWPRHRGVVDDPGLELVVEGPSLSLYRVRAWKGLVVDEEGRPVGAESPLAPLVFLERATGGLMYRPGQRGWMQGWNAAEVDRAGVVELPGGATVVWFWPTLVVLGAYSVQAILFVLMFARRVKAGGRRGDRIEGKGETRDGPDEDRE